ncbi:MAG TPA: flagellar biosynthesis protein FlhB [Tepidisphaeraceae bacterium]|jgi:flagellar biosynthetic protein FlhB
MADEDGDKTEAPTARKRAEARENGQIARSTDLTASVGLLASILLLSWFGGGAVQTLRDFMTHCLGASLLETDQLDLGGSVRLLALNLAFAIGPIVVGLMVVAVVMNLAQVGFFLSTKRIEPKFDALNPLKGLKRIFGKGQGAVTLGMNLAKLVLIAAVAYSAVHDRLAVIAGAQQLSEEQIFGLGATIIYDIALRIAVLLIVLAVIDYAWQKFKIEKELKMTKQEVKEEMKRMDGDPHIKQRRRQIQQQRAVQRMRKDVPTADVIVTNPTHYSIALKYDPTGGSAPKVVAKGADFLAFRIREIAAEHGVPILERPPLARALYRSVEVGQEIPEQYYAAVAEILAYVYELSGKTKRRQQVA